MGKVTGIAVLFAAFFIAFYTTTIVPDGFTQPWKARALLAGTRFVLSCIQCSTYFGFHEGHVLRYFFGLSAIPKYQQNDTHVNLLDTTIEGVNVRLFWPVKRKSTDKMAGLVYFHGGGWTIGSVGVYSQQTYELSKRLDAFVVSVDYRLAPENIFPAANDDCFKVTKYFLKHAEKYGVDANRISVIGDSAGGNLAATVAIRLRDEKVQPKLKLQVLIYPMTQATDFNTPSMVYNKYGPFLYQASAVYFCNMYLFGHEQNIDVTSKNMHTSSEYKKTFHKQFFNYSNLPNDEIKQFFVPLSDEVGDTALWTKYGSTLLNPYFSPLHAKSLQGLPKTYISTCQHDVLRDDGYFYAVRLKKDTVKVTHVNLDVCFHGWLGFLLDLETSQKHFQDIVLFMSKNL